jgi:hypothetical protein
MQELGIIDEDFKVRTKPNAVKKSRLGQPIRARQLPSPKRLGEEVAFLHSAQQT